jgi:hypothetical protein
MGKVREQLDVIFNKEMDRKNFLKYSGGILLGVLGITGLLRLLAGSPHTQMPDEHPVSNGYGSSRYGQ